VSVMTADPLEPEGAGDAALWTVAALVVAALHVGLAAAYLVLRPVPEGQATAPAIDVAFMPAESPPAPAAPEAMPAVPAPPVAQSSIEPPKDSLKEEPAVSPPAVAEPVPQPEPPLPSVALTAPEPPAPDQLTVAPPLPPKPAEAAPAKKPIAPEEHAARKPAQAEKADKEKEEKHKAAQARPAAAQASRSTRVALAPSSGAESPGAREGIASWKSEVLARIRSAASYPANSRDSGTAQIVITIARNGRLASRHLAGSSGSSTLDSAAMSIVERAQPFPPFPAGMAQGQIALTVPLHLHPR
jgi:periplasmic protein TonB